MGIFRRDEKETFGLFKLNHAGIKVLLKNARTESLDVDEAFLIADRLLDQRRLIQWMLRRRPDTGRRMCRRWRAQHKRFIALVRSARMDENNERRGQLEPNLLIQRYRGKVRGSLWSMLYSSSRAGDALRRRLFGGTRGNEAAGSANDLR